MDERGPLETMWKEVDEEATKGATPNNRDYAHST